MFSYFLYLCQIPLNISVGEGREVNEIREECTGNTSVLFKIYYFLNWVVGTWMFIIFESVLYCVHEIVDISIEE